MLDKNFIINQFLSHLNNQILLKMDPKWEWKQGNQCFVLPLYHIYGFGIMINCILSGGCGILLKAFDPDIFCRTIQNYKVYCWFFFLYICF